MKNSKATVSAFTLLELTFALLIAAICIGMAFYVLHTFIRMGRMQQQQKERIFSIQHFHHRMLKDVAAAEHIVYEEQTLSLRQKEHKVYYHFLDSLVIRQQDDLTTDSLFAYTENLDIQQVKQLSENLVRSFSFKLSLDKVWYPFTFRKDYSAEQLIHLSIMPEE